jgi:DnaJ-class molecular chaperone
MLDPYKVLGVTKDTPDADIKKAYRKLSKKYHPDLNAGSKEAEKKFKELGEAFELISNKESRDKHAYSQEAPSQQERPFYHQSQGQGNRYNNIFEGDNEDLFSSFFGSQAKARSRDAHYTMDISVEEAIHGGSREIVLPTGKQLKVKIPKGISEGTKLRFKGHGEPGPKESGDAYVEIHFKSSKRFQIEGDDLVSDLPISLDEAIHGTQIEFTTVDGPILLKIPAGVNNGSKLKIKGKGLPCTDKKSCGNQYVVIRVTLPSTIDPELSQFIKTWTKDHPYNPRSEVS